MLKTIADRLRDKIDRSAGPKACWPWLGKINNKYGHIYYDGKQRPAHVAVLELHTGEKAGNRYALHDCDNPPCCNPRHLYWGTPADNVRDRDERGRHKILRGEAHGGVVLTERQVKAIRRRHVPRHPHHGASALGREFGVSTSTVHCIVHGKLWSHL